MPDSPKDKKGDDLLFFGAGLSKPKQAKPPPSKPAEEMVDLVSGASEDAPVDPFYRGDPAPSPRSSAPAEAEAPKPASKPAEEAKTVNDTPKIKDEAPAVPPPRVSAPGAAREENAGAPARAEITQKLKQTFSFKKKTYKDELKEVLAESKDAVSLGKWRKKGFASLGTESEAEDEELGLGARLLIKAKKRPLAASLILMTALVIFVADLLVLMRHLNITQFNPIDYAKDRGAAAWDDRDTALSLLDRGALANPGAGKPEDEITASAVQGANELAEGLVTPALPSGLGGIVNPESKEDKKRLRKKDGVEVGGGGAVALGPQGRPLDTLDRTRIARTEADDFTPYSGAAKAGGGAASAGGVYFGEAGEFLGNYASISNGAKKDADFKAPDADGDFPTVPEGLHGEELVQAMIGDGLMEELKRYAKEGTWRMRRASGAKQDVPEVDGNALANSYAAGQLLETKRETDKAMKCGTCTNESRINMERATFYGERY